MLKYLIFVVFIIAPSIISTNKIRTDYIDPLPNYCGINDDYCLIR